ncbi:glycoside hydrolase family 127 protein [Aquipuribacter hungaricus]|uniref:Glycoside hydrolase family 127 protein n=1 Tax=Aquipuribacter hungaricus TaxID=545624 RepID=A0ABV7WHK8_9MICO
MTSQAVLGHRTTGRADAPGSGRPVDPVGGTLRPLGVHEVQITGGFWGDRQRTNGERGIAHVEHWLEREGWLGNFDAAVQGRLPQDRTGREFADTEVYKLLEAMAWEIGRTGSPALEARFAAIVSRVSAAQEPDGYVGTCYGRPGQAPRWSDLEWGHELYGIGHLVQAAVARARVSGVDDELVRVACRAADHVCEVFGADGIQSVDGHPEIEPALVELYRVTGQARYLEQARLFVERRGHQVLEDVEFGRSYFQDDVPVREADVLRGHAVRATYLASGAVDVAVETGDTELLAAVDRQWRATVARRTYVTGGMGSRHQDEAFGEDWVLPPDRAYSETCAGIGSVMLSWRLLLATGETRFADLVERTLFNVVATSPGHDGTSFFYTNTLHQRVLGSVPDPDRAVGRAASSLRAPWFSVSCCPTNVARTFASLGAYLATVDDDGLQLHQYAPSRVSTRLADGRRIELEVRTEYPRAGSVRVVVLEDAGSPWTLSLRVPGWAAGAVLEVDGASEPVAPGTVTVHRRFRAGEQVVLELPVQPRLTRPHPRIDAVRGCVAVERGPEVLCAESVDLPFDGSVDDLVVDPSAPLVEVDGAVTLRARRVVTADAAWPYDPAGPGGPAGPSGLGAGGSPAVGSPSGGSPVGRAGHDASDGGPRQPVDEFDVVLRPYHDWANRGPATMRVWLPTV